jgi:ferredoxin
MTSLRRKWGFYLCRCSLPQPFAAAELEAEGAVLELADGPAALPAFAARLRKAFAEEVLFACACTAPEQLAAACEAVGIAPEIHPLALREATLAVHDPAEAGAKALRLLRGTAAALDARGALTQNLLTVAGRVALFADRREGLELARRLQGRGSLVVFLEGGAEAFGALPRAVNWGRPERVTGRLGALEVQVAPVQGSDFSQPQRIQADQVVVLGARAAALQGRTGLHRLPAPDAQGLDAALAAIAELTGEFSKPEHVQYDAALCAGGAAEMEACGRCIPACPYDAIARDAAQPLRVRVDHLACEGCGACASACPTSALRFSEPAPEALYAQLAALLEPAGGNGAGGNGAGAPAILFHCEQQGRGLLEWAAANEAHYPARLLPVQVPCLRYVSDAAMLAALRMGAAGVGLLGCEECPNGERTLLLGKLALAQQVLEAFALGGQRLRLLTVDEAHRPEGVQALHTFAESLGAAPLPAAPAAQRGRLHGTGNREVLADAIGAFIAATGKEVGGLRVGAEQPFALAAVDDTGCTLCRACATVCPTHAFTFDVDAQTLSFKHIACVNCGLCARVCPEHVITLRPELYLERAALESVAVARDEMVHCARCDKPYINRRALETVEARLRAAQNVQNAFSGTRASLLRMCPDCRAVAAMLEVEQGWTP